MRRASDLDVSRRRDLLRPEDPPDLLVVARGTMEETLIITDRQESAIAGEIRFGSVVCIILGFGILFMELVYFAVKWIAR